MVHQTGRTVGGGMARAVRPRRMSSGIGRARARGGPDAGGLAVPAAPSRDDGAFAAMLTSDSATAAGAQAASAGLSGVAWLQANVADVFTRAAQDRDARRHGRALLQALAGVQRAALAGDGDQAKAALAALAETVRNGHEADDAVLRLILREIDVRAAVELARAEAQAAAHPP